MKQTNKLLLLTAALTMGLGTSAAFAQDFGDFGGFDDSFGSEDSAAGSLGSGSKLEVSGSASLDLRAYVDTSSDDDSDSAADKIEMEATPSATVDLSYSGNKSDMELSLCVDADRIQAHPEDVIDELVLRGRFGDYFTLEAGKMKLVWGKGDKLHVLDNFNADDYSDFIIPDYLDRRISTPMVRGIVSLPFANLNIEGVYTPFLPVDRFATSGRWTPAQVASLTGLVTADAEGMVADSFTRYTTATATAGTLTALNADYLAAQKAYSTAYDETYQKALDAGKLQAATELTKQGVTALYGAAAWDAMDEATKTAAIQKTLTENAAAIEAGVAEKLTQETIDGLLRANGYGYYLDNLTVSKEEYEAACKEAGFDAESIKTELEDAGSAYMYALTYASSLSADPSVIYPDLWTLKYGQFGGRATWTLGMVDMGISYYNGWYKQPSFNASKLDSFISTYLANGSVDDKDKFLAYDKKQTFGLEASSIIWHFNVRGEFAYNLTDDTDGTDPWVHNNSLAWLGGFDIDLPFWNANLNVQETGTFILHGSDCDTNLDSGLLDVDYAANGYSNNKIVCNFTASFMNDKIAPEVTVMYGIENKDLVVMPKLSFKADQNLTLAASGMYIWCGDDNSEFKSWEKNSFVNIAAEYKF
ncbi:MAG: hypothetical protein IJ688_11925 [Treponema sp.]|nr:hypothetical protein [Treponema sp.]